MSIDRRQTQRAEIDRRSGQDRRERIDAALDQLTAERRQHERRVSVRRACDNARANRICLLVYEARQRYKGPPR